MKYYDYLIVGSGLFGATFAYRARQVRVVLSLDRINQLAEQYRALASQELNVIFGGRLAEYKYYDMAPIVEKVLGMKL